MSTPPSETPSPETPLPSEAPSPTEATSPLESPSSPEPSQPEGATGTDPAPFFDRVRDFLLGHPDQPGDAAADETVEGHP